MFNRAYQIRATREGLKNFMALEFYRPADRPDPRLPRGPRRREGDGAEQLKLFEATSPLRDVFPEAYQ